MPLANILKKFFVKSQTAVPVQINPSNLLVIFHFLILFTFLKGVNLYFQQRGKKNKNKTQTAGPRPGSCSLV